MAARAVGSQYREQFAHGIFLTVAPFFQQVFLNASARFSGTIGPQMGYWRDAFSQTALRRATVRCDGLAGQPLRSTMQETSRRLRMEQSRATFCLGSPPEMAKITQRPWQGSSPWIRSRCTSTAKAPSRQSMGTRLDQASVFPRRGQGSKAQGSCDRERCGGWANFPLVQKE